MMKKNKSGLIFTSPFYILFLTFMVYPILFSFYLSFNKWNGVGEMEWVGLANYINLFRDDLVWKSMFNALFFFFTYVPIMLFLALILAVFLNSNIKGRGFFRAAVYLPNITSLVAVAFTFQLLLDKNYGLLNMFLSYLGISSINWLGTPLGARLSIDMLMIWRWLGYNTIILLAGLQSIPEEMYEAAIIDGASKIQSFFRITVPLMKPVLLFTLVLSTIGTFRMFTEVFILTGGGPANSTLTPVVHLYNTGFNWFKFGYASSITYLIILITLMLSMVQMRLLNEKEVKN